MHLPFSAIPTSACPQTEIPTGTIHKKVVQVSSTRNQNDPATIRLPHSMFCRQALQDTLLSSPNLYSCSTSCCHRRPAIAPFIPFLFSSGQINIGFYRQKHTPAPRSTIPLKNKTALHTHFRFILYLGIVVFWKLIRMSIHIVQG